MKPDLASGSKGNTYSIKKQSSRKTHFCDSSIMKQSTETNIEYASKPVNSGELVVQKKKVAEVKHWLELAFSTSHKVLTIFTYLCKLFLTKCLLSGTVSSTYWPPWMWQISNFKCAVQGIKY